MSVPSAPKLPDSPRRRDGLALGFLAVSVLVLLFGVGLAWRALHDDAPPPAQAPAAESFAKRWERLVAYVQAQLATVERPPLPWETSAPSKGTGPAIVFPAIQAPAQDQAPVLPPGSRWSYRVSFGPDYRPAGRLIYTTAPASVSPSVPTPAPSIRMQWAPDGGKATSWDFGVFAPGHPSHKNVRFPGFFMHAAYFPFPLEKDAVLSWSFPWQLPDGSMQPGRERRFEARIAGWEDVRVPAGRFAAARLDVVLRYVEGRTVRAELRNTLWYAPEARQVVRVLWSGRAPDEGSEAILAELAEIRLP